MSYESKRLDRRTFLRGLGGAAVGLPLLECMLPDGTRKAMAAGEEKPGPFFITGFSGHAIGQGGSKDADRTGLFTDQVSPGDGLEITRALTPLAQEFEHPSGETRKVKDYVSLISNLYIKHEEENGGETPPAGVPTDPNGRAKNPAQWHGYQMLPQFAGMAGHSPHSPVPGREAYSADQLVAEEWDDPLSMYVRAQAGWYGGNNPSAVSNTNDSISYNGSRRVPTVDPQKAYTDLFSNAPDDLGSDRSREEIARRRLFAQFRERSVVDAVHESFEKLKKNPSLSAADRRRVQAHVEELRTLEKRIESLRKRLAQERPACEQPDEYPGLPINGSAGWSHEDRRARLHVDLIVFAFRCGLTRVASLELLEQQSRLNVGRMIDENIGGGLHGNLHSGLGGRGRSATEKVIAWDLQQYAYLFKRLGETPLFPGSSESLLDRTAFSLFFDGGFGWNFQGDDPRKNGHSGYNMAAFTAGRAGGLVGDRHIVTDQRHPAEVTMTAMESVGVSRNRFGELDWKTIPELRQS